VTITNNFLKGIRELNRFSLVPWGWCPSLLGQHYPQQYPQVNKITLPSELIYLEILVFLQFLLFLAS
jgi:hypothetical protein